jgi:hypothetical protein
MRKFLLSPLLFLFFIPFTLHGQQRFYVNDDAVGLNTGQSWADAFTDLHLALQPAQAGDEIWVAEGFYLPDTASDRNRTFTMPSGVRLLGGFAGTEQTAQERMPETHVTTLSGNIGNPADSTDNAFTILYMAYPDENTYVSGFTLEHGYAKSDTSFGNVSPYRAGGAVYVMMKDSTAYPVFDRCLFRNNYAGGNGGAIIFWGQLTKGCSPQFRYCKFENNSCGYNGGAVWLQGGSLVDKGVEFYHCKFINNRAIERAGALAGGVYFRKRMGIDTLEFRNCEIISNGADAIGGFLVTEGSIISRSVIIDSCYVSKNYGRTSFGLLSNFWGTGIGDYSNMGTVIISNNTFDNQPDSSSNAMIRMYSTSPLFKYQIKNNQFINNSGSIEIENADSVLIQNNYLQATSKIYTEGKSIFIFGNVLNGKESQIGISKNTSGGKINIANNKIIGSGNLEDYPSPYDLPLFISAYDSSPQDTIYLLNNTIMNTWFRPPSLFPPPTSNLKIYAQNNIFLNNYNAATGEKCLPFWHDLDQLDFDYNLTDFDCSTLSGLEVLCGDHNLIATTSPFVDTSLGDYHLLPCAQGINGGTPLFFALAGVQKDLQGDDRIQGTAPDIGPYEHKASVINGVFNTSISCGGSPTGSFSVQIGGGCPPYSIAWNGPGNSSGNQTDQLVAGQYFVTVSDSKGDILIASLTIDASDTLLIPSPLIIDAGGNEIANGTIDIVPTGGQPPYTALWNDGGEGLERSQLLPGSYTVTVTDTKGCTSTGTYAVGTVTVHDAGRVSPKIWPNPVDEVLYISGNDLVIVSIYNAMGRLVMEQITRGGQLFFFNTANLLEGIYFIKAAYTDSTVYSGRFVKI